MSRRCEELREKALSEGLNSREALAWRVHCRSCPDCRTELFVLETLQRQAQSERRHLGRNEVVALLETARGRQRSRRRPVATAWTWSLRVACVLIVALVAMELPFEQGGQPIRSKLMPLSGSETQHALELLPGDRFGSGQTEGRLAGGGATRGAAVHAAEAVGLPEAGLNRRLFDLRQQIDRSRSNLLELIEDDLGNASRLDVWQRMHTAPAPAA